jgi:hypothetical protein
MVFEKIMQSPFSRSRQRPCDLSPAFQSRDRQRISSQSRQRRLILQLGVNRRCGDEEVLLHLFFKHHIARPAAI